jgi:sortase A
MTATVAPADEREDVAHPPDRPGPAEARPPTFTGRLVTRLFILLSVALLGFAGYLLLLTPISQRADQEALYDQLRGAIAEGISPYLGRSGSDDGTIQREVPGIYADNEDSVIPAGAPVAVLDIPSIGVRQVVVEGTSSGDLRLGPGHRRDTVLPGQKGVSLIYGRTTTFGGPLHLLPTLTPGAELTVVTFQGSFTFRVEGVRRAGDPLPDPQPVKAGGSRLTMVTAEGDNILQPGRTVFVDAMLRGDAQPAATHPKLIPAEERSLASDRPALLSLVLWLQGLVLLVGFMAWARIRWGRWETYLVCVPAVLAVLWNVYEATARLLPNLT